MKVATKELSQKFTPFDLVITIESEEEQNVLRTLFARDSVIPDFLLIKNYLNKTQSSLLSQIMIPIWYEILKK